MAPGKHREMTDYTDTEEFLATHMQNVYLDCRGKTRYYRTHDDPVLRTKDHIYLEFVEDGQVIQALQHFVNNETLARVVAQWQLPFPRFNPWRDFPQLERIYLDRSGTPNGTMLPL